MEETEYKDGEKVQFKTKGKLSRPDETPEDVECFVTEGHVVIEAEEQLKIPLLHIEGCYVNVRVGRSSVVWLHYRDASGRSRKTELTTSAIDAGALSNALETARNAPKIARLRQRWRDAWSRELPYQTPPAAKPTKTFMGFFRIRDERRDKLCADLCAIGLDARMVERGQLQEEVDGLGDKSLGLIEIRHSPIRLVNVFKAEGMYGSSYRNVYLVPDFTIVPDSPTFWEGYGTYALGYGKSVRVKSVPLFGRVVDLCWEGNFKGNLIKRLDKDVSLKESLIRLEEDINIISYPEYGCWTISPPSLSDQPDHSIP